MSVCKEKLELFIFGYVRLNHKNEIPADVTRICLYFYHKLYLKIEIIWDVFCKQVADFVSEDGLGVNINVSRGYSTFASSTGWNKGIHAFTIKQIEAKKCQYGVGIISSEHISTVKDKDDEYFMWTQNKEAHGYSLDGNGNIYSIQDAAYQHQITWKPETIGDEKVTLIVDCNQWKVRFYLNDEECDKSFDLMQSKTYHAVFTVWTGNTSYQLVETTVDVEKEKTMTLPQK